MCPNRRSICEGRFKCSLPDGFDGQRRESPFTSGEANKTAGGQPGSLACIFDVCREEKHVVKSDAQDLDLIGENQLLATHENVRLRAQCAATNVH